MKHGDIDRYVYINFHSLFPNQYLPFPGMIAYILIRSKIVFSQIDLGDYWKVMSVIIVSAFSERFIPNMLVKVENQVGKK